MGGFDTASESTESKESGSKTKDPSPKPNSNRGRSKPNGASANSKRKPTAAVDRGEGIPPATGRGRDRPPALDVDRATVHRRSNADRDPDPATVAGAGGSRGPDPSGLRAEARTVVESTVGEEGAAWRSTEGSRGTGGETAGRSTGGASGEATDDPSAGVATGTTGGETPSVVREVVSSEGRSLDPEVREFMESRMGDSFGDVRIHTGPKAAAAAEAIDARAFTVGNHVAFNRGEYDPTSPQGKHLIAHELAHVRQQPDGDDGSIAHRLPKDPDLAVGDPDSRHEREADRVARAVIDPTADASTGPTPAGISLQRTPEGKVRDAIEILEDELPDEEAQRIVRDVETTFREQNDGDGERMVFETGGAGGTGERSVPSDPEDVGESYREELNRLNLRYLAMAREAIEEKKGEVEALEEMPDDREARIDEAVAEGGTATGDPRFSRQDVEQARETRERIERKKSEIRDLERTVAGIVSNLQFPEDQKRELAGSEGDVASEVGGDVPGIVFDYAVDLVVHASTDAATLDQLIQQLTTLRGPEANATAGIITAVLLAVTVVTAKTIAGEKDEETGSGSGQGMAKSQR